MFLKNNDGNDIQACTGNNVYPSYDKNENVSKFEELLS